MDPHSFTARAEAQRWLAIAEKLLMGHDIVGAKTFAIRARESDPRLEAGDQILAIADTLLAAEKRVVGSNGTQQPDYYAILQLVRFVQEKEHIAAQYRRLAVTLNPHQNRYPYSDQAFQLVNEAWTVLSNPMRKSMYDSELDFAPQQQMNSIGFNLEEQHHHQQHQHNFFSINHTGSSHEQELAEPQQTFQTRVQRSHQQHHNFLSQPIPVRPSPVREQEQLFQQREQEQLFQPQVQPFQITSTSQQQSRPQQPLQPQPPIRSPTPPPPVAPPQPPASWPQAHSQPQHQQPQPSMRSSTPPAAPPQPPVSWPQAPPHSQPLPPMLSSSHHPPPAAPPQPPVSWPQALPRLQPQQPMRSSTPPPSAAPPQPPVSWPEVPPQSRPQPPHPQSQLQSQPQQHQHMHSPAPPQPQPQPQQQLQRDLHEQQQQPESPEQNATPLELPNQVDSNSENIDASPTFWTACPYCLYMYEYPSVYAECTLRCDNCDRAFQAVPIPSPPPITEDQETYFCCWGSFPLGLSISHLEKKKFQGTNKNWTPFSPIYDVSSQVQNHLNNITPKKTRNWGPRIYKDDETDDIFTDISEPSDDSDADWDGTKNKKVKKMKKRGRKRKAKVLAVNKKTNKSVSVRSPPTVALPESSKRALVSNPRRQSDRVAKEMGKLDLNVEFNNEGEEAAPRMASGNRQGEEDNIEGNGFFEGLDEFLSSLPILSVVNEEKVKAG